ncbi:MAG TPA: thioesterase family protein [Acidimicrobiales bacterium]|nr:thioesterase family protein [Acidimicrobiales bacterium]
MSGDGPDPTGPGSFSHWATDRVRFSDQDAVGHINNVAMAAYVETGRVAFGHDLRVDDDPGASFILARLAIDYRAQGHYPGEVRIGTRLQRIGRTSFTVVHGVFKDERCLATAEGVLVFVRDGAPAAIDGAFRQRLESLLGD